MPDLIIRNRALSSIWQDFTAWLAVFHNWQWCWEIDAATQAGAAIGNSNTMATINKQRRMSMGAISELEGRAICRR